MAMTNSADDLITETPSDLEIVWQRTFKAPRRLLFDAWTRCDLLKRWFAPNGWSLPVCEVDLVPGGAYRYVMRKDDGAEMVIGGVHREVVPPERFSASQVFEGFSEVGWRPQDVCQFTMEFVEHDGTTTWTMRLVYPSREARDAVLQMGMEFDRLDQFLQEELAGTQES